MNHIGSDHAGHTAFPASGVPRPEATPAARTAILVLGMSRSGTSLCTRVLNILGANLPQDLVGPAPSNPTGHWEPKHLVALNDGILREFGRSWDDPRPMPAGWQGSPIARNAIGQIAERIALDYSGESLLLIKDPRICRLAPLYFAALEALRVRPLVVHCTRHPSEICRSLASRDGMAAAHSELLWLRHLTEAEAASRPYRRAWLSFAGLLGNWQQETDNVARMLGLAWPNQPEWIWPEMERAVQSALRHWTMGDTGASTAEGALAARAWKGACHGLAGDEATTRILFDEVAGALAEFDRLSGIYDDRHARALRAIHGSTSWRVTAPLLMAKLLASCLPACVGRLH